MARSSVATLCLENKYFTLALVIMVVYGYLFMIHAFASQSSPDIGIETKAIVIAAQDYIDYLQKQHISNPVHISDDFIHQNATDDAKSTQHNYLADAIHHNKYEKDDFSFFWTSGDGSPLFINASKYDTNHDIGYQSFVFCPMPKNGCSAWKQVLRRIKGEQFYLADDFWSLHSPQNNLEQDRIHNFGVNGANSILYDPDIIHAVFVRDSIERSLSAFLDKCIGSHWATKYWCNPKTDKTNKITHKIYSHFDLYIDAIINKPLSLSLDFHWLPQNFVCDLYKYAARYNIYYAHDIRARYQFLYDIGGKQTWNKIGANGWVKKQVQNEQRSRRLLPKAKQLKQKPVLIMGGNATEQMKILELSGSFLDKESYHTIHAALRLLQFYRADLLSKVVAYYESDYILFNLSLPQWICKFVNVSAIMDVMDRGNGYFDAFRDEIEMLSYGEYAIYHDEYNHNATVNNSAGNIWSRNEEINERMTRFNTFINGFQDMLEFDKKYGTIIHTIRGIAVLSNILTFVDVSILPKCFRVEDDWDYTKIAKKEKNDIKTLIARYFNGYLKQKKMENDSWQAFVSQDLKQNGFVNAQLTYMRWREEDKILYHNIGENVLWMREIPRKTLWRRFNE